MPHHVPGHERARIRQELDRYAWWLDDCLRVPGTSWRFGADAIIGLIPGFGDAVTTAAGLVMVVRARQLGAPGRLQRKMLVNLGIDFAVGVVPLVGDLFDFAWQANRRNLELLRAHWAEPLPEPPTSRRIPRWLLAAAALVAGIALIGWIAA